MPGRLPPGMPGYGHRAERSHPLEEIRILTFNINILQLGCPIFKHLVQEYPGRIVDLKVRTANSRLLGVAYTCIVPDEGDEEMRILALMIDVYHKLSETPVIPYLQEQMRRR